MFDLSLFVYCIIYFPWRDVFCDFRLQRYGGLTKQMFQNRKMISQNRNFLLFPLFKPKRVSFDAKSNFAIQHIFSAKMPCFSRIMRIFAVSNQGNIEDYVW
jgi:hypothetical protein